ncbi:MAG TPA: hypothetical protein VFN35_29610 [Ktedonobacteraceae bacterium]|nr:hypothetical protein [Ktedonobacteraceae bacterium]
MQHNVPTLAEGDTTPGPTTGSIQYTGVTSCLTLTILYSDGTASGGHASLTPSPGQRTIEDVVDELQRQSREKTVARVVVAGEVKLWNQRMKSMNWRYRTVEQIIDDLRKGATYIQYDSREKLEGKKAYMSLSADHRILIIKSENNKVVHSMDLSRYLLY